MRFDVGVNLLFHGGVVPSLNSDFLSCNSMFY